MTITIAQTIGIDISKDTLDVAFYPDERSRQFKNTPDGHRALIRWLTAYDVTRLIFEATGAYHHELERTLRKQGLPAIKVNPKQAKRFGQATGRLAKTDRADAYMLAQFGAVLKPDPGTFKCDILDQLTELLSARQALIKNQIAQKNRLKTKRNPLLQSQGKQHLKQIKAIEKECRGLIKQDQGLQDRFLILESIPGLGFITSLSILAHMPELGKMNEKQVASLAGLAPITRQSGKWQGKSFIQGGRKNIRDALYIPALVAVRFNKDFEDKYQALLGAGKLKKVALVAIMRKMLILANALLRDQRKWTEIKA
ncbi:IS110 family transposase [Paremcibacter congregatus]|uniref:IS110 family transposase n=1 Tax=Paremcibacter congregatus TaxID=2043170 RepID=A0A2G4YWN2_9PROT|nr:IS110 family transposase [Paremcibacter congregatus]PHZ86752.1 IS110 family transposase [Paremcibacter congregatus]QDE28002.1 IS110 family transposase [Paremcibacter congregatus]